MVIGIDEAGRGPWAGPLTVAAVGLNENTEIPGLTDSKLLSPARRSALLPAIQSRAHFIHIVWISSAQLDELGLSQAMYLAVGSLVKHLPAQAKELIIDGNVNYGREAGARALVKADALIPAVAAASIVAKVRRDAYMERMANRYRLYGFDKHKGYGTAAHRQALEQFGPSNLHRLSFKPVQSLLK